MSCPKAIALHLALRMVWNLPAEVLFKNTVPYWFLILLDQLSPATREQTIFMLWRAWHLRNDLIFAKGKESISASMIFVQNYLASISSCQTKAQGVISKKRQGIGGGHSGFE